jgi:hypothetical protein
MDVSIYLDDYFSDPDGDDLTFTLELLGPSLANGTLDGGGASWRLTPTANWYGDLFLKATARDPHLSVVEGDIQVLVRRVNDPPHVVEPPIDMVTSEDSPLYAALNISGVFADVDGDVLQYNAISDLGVYAILNGTWLDLVPEQDWVGVVTISLTAFDPSLESAEVTFSLMVGEVNDPPVVVDSWGPPKIHETSNATFWVLVEDPDSVELTYRWTIDGVTVPGETGSSFDYAPGDLNSAAVVVLVEVEDDWQERVSKEWTVTILDSPRIVSSSPPTNVEALVGDTVSFSVEVEDRDTPEPTVDWTWKGAVVGRGPDLELVLDTDDVGTDDLEVYVSDGMGEERRIWHLTVVMPDYPPVLTLQSPAANTTFNQGDIILLRSTVDDEDPAGVTVRWFVDGSPVGSGRDVAYTATRVGDLVIQVSAIDGNHTVTASVAVVVKAPGGNGGDGDGGNGDVTSPWSSSWALVLVALVVLVVVSALVGVWALRMRRGPRD